VDALGMLDERRPLHYARSKGGDRVWIG